MRGGANSSVDTVNAAATAIISADSRVQQVRVPRRRWAGGWLSVYWCFGTHKHTKRINRAVLVPEPTSSASEPPISQNPNHQQTLTSPVIAPPSSPASFVNSEPPSSAPSPGGFFSLSANAYSPTGPASIFAIGPYANETQLVSPPVFSTFTTEPNTAPFTPPPESVQITTPSSPEVPFAQLLSSSFKKREFQTYMWCPGSPIGHLISPSSVCSGTSSPFPDTEIDSSRRHSSIFDGQISAIVPDGDDDRRVSFELSAEEVARCMEKKVVESSGSKEFKFSNSDGSGAVEPSVGSEWWVNEKVVSAEVMSSKKWAFFPTVPSGVIS